MNEKIIAMVGRSPGIKTGQIADQLDVDFSEAQMLLAKLANEGRIKGALSALSGGGKVMSWELCGIVPAKPMPAVEKQEAVPLPKELVAELSKKAQAEIEKSPAEAAAAIAAKRTYKRQPAGHKGCVPTPDVGEMRCCMWTDGVLEVQVGGRTVMTLNKAGQDMLRKALNA
jgi:hypothetical protein